MVSRLYEPADATITGEDIRYQTQISAPGEFEGVSARWYVSPAYYTIDLERSVSNLASSPTTGLLMDVILFNNDDDWQFSSLVESDPLPEMMYVDEETNLHGLFELGEILPGATTNFTIAAPASRNIASVQKMAIPPPSGITELW